MESYGKLIVIFIPVFILMIIAEKWYGWYFKKDAIRPLDMLSSLSSGYVMVVKETLKLTVFVLSYEQMVKYFAIYQIESKWWMYVVAFLAIDFQVYWGHRVAHTVNLFWNKHVIHHSAEGFDLAIALRQSISNIVNVTVFFLLPAALLGIPYEVIGAILPIHLFMQFWYHTIYIGKLGWIEKILVTPSHHRVHHAMNPEYMDKNYSAIFIVWDKLFGTFQEERSDVPVVFGVTRPVKTWNPIRINFQHLWLMIQDAWHAQRFWDKCRIWFMPTGWRPQDVEKQYPIEKIDNVYQFTKYHTQLNQKSLIWVWIQNIVTLLVMVYLFVNFKSLGFPEVYIYGGFIFLMVFVYSEFMDKRGHSTYFELVKNIIGMGLIIVFNGWFGSSNWALNVTLAIYFVASTPITFYLAKDFHAPSKI